MAVNFMLYYSVTLVVTGNLPAGLTTQYNCSRHGVGATWPIGDRLKRPHYLSRVDHERKIRSRRQRTDIGKYSFVNRTIQHCNQLPAEVLGIIPSKPITFKKRVRKVIIEFN